MRVLITNFQFAQHTGSELYVRDIATGLLDRDHTPIVYSTHLGGLALEMTDLTIPVVDDLSKLGTAPDIIHGQHNPELMAALLYFPNVPAIRFCHGWRDDRPQQFPRILRYVAVDATTRDRVLYEWGIPEDRVRMVLNFVDLDRFQPRRDPLPVQAKRALVFSNLADESVWAARKACERMGISVDAMGESVGTASAAPEKVLGNYDIVFAKGRCAIEALASGAAVVLCDVGRLGPMVTSHQFDQLRQLNFGLRTLRKRLTVEALAQEIARYDPRDASEVSRRIRKTAGRDVAIEAVIELYREVIDEYRQQPPPDLHREMRCAGDYIQSLTPRLRHPDATTAIRVLLRDIHRPFRRLPLLRSIVRMPSLVRLQYRLKRMLRIPGA